MVDLLIKIDLIYAKNGHVNKSGKRVLYVKLKKTIYGWLRAARILYSNLAGKIQSLLFDINIYDLCVANKTTNGKQCTGTWHVDNLKISHKERKVVDSVISQLESRYGNLSFNRENKQMYAGMDIEYCKDRSVEILMKLYLLKVIDEFEEFGKNITSSKPTPAAVYLFNVDETATLLND